MDDWVAHCIMTTLLAASSGVVGAGSTIWLKTGKLDVGMAANGALAGLVSITAGTGAMNFLGAVISGLIGGVIVVYSIIWIEKKGIDDPVGAISVHGICGIWGTIAVGIFSTNPEHSFSTQVIGTLSYAAFAFVVSLILALLAKATLGFRVDEDEEYEGLDLSEHGQPAYADFQNINN